ncbi:MAG: bifunctional adenosylcobinamide kinase/adenosylcobinamide-phosphate guanylyltransferase [Dermatophilaceae bacterium]
MTTVFVLGGARSGKSRYAEHLLGAELFVHYVAPGREPDDILDPEWADRVAAHRRGRPASWKTWETGDVPGVLRSADGAVLVDCLGTWVTRLIDDAAAWDDRSGAHAEVERATENLVAALRDTTQHAVLVSNETGCGIVPASPSGRLFRDCLGRVNARVADSCDRVVLVVAGRVLDLTDRPLIARSPQLPARDCRPAG